MRRQLVLSGVLAGLCVALAGCGNGGGAVDKGPEPPPLKSSPADKGKPPVKVEQSTN